MSVETFKAKGNDAFKNKKYPDAIADYTKAIELDPASESSGALYSNRAASYSALGQHEKGLEDAEACIRVRPDWLKGYFRKAVALEALKRIDEAARAYGEALRTEPKNEEVQGKVAELNDAIKKRNNSAKPSDMKSPDEARVIGNSLFGLGQYEKAEEFYTRALDLYDATNKAGSEAATDRANVYANRAACKQQSHNYRGVIEDCTLALEACPTHTKAMLRRAIAYEGLEKWKLAMEDYQQVNQLSPGMQNVSQGLLRCRRQTM